MRPALSLLPRLLLTAAAAFSLTPAASVAQRASPATIVTMGEGGSHIIGSPAARVKLTEYVSYTCPHCANFSAESAQPLRTAYIARGTVNVEIRHIIRDPVDMAMAVAADCGAPAQFPARHESLMAQQSAILARVSALTEERIGAWRQAPAEQRLRLVADAAGVTDWMRQRGFTPAQINACLASTQAQERLVTMTNAANRAGVTGTPSFAINGQLLNSVHSWAQLQPRIDAALAAR